MSSRLEWAKGGHRMTCLRPVDIISTSPDNLVHSLTPLSKCTICEQCDLSHQYHFQQGLLSFTLFQSAPQALPLSQTRGLSTLSTLPILQRPTNFIRCVVISPRKVQAAHNLLARYTFVRHLERDFIDRSVFGPRRWRRHNSPLVTSRGEPSI